MECGSLNRKTTVSNSLLNGRFGKSDRPTNLYDVSLARKFVETLAKGLLQHTERCQSHSTAVPQVLVGMGDGHVVPLGRMLNASFNDVCDHHYTIKIGIA